MTVLLRPLSGWRHIFNSLALHPSRMGAVALAAMAALGGISQNARAAEPPSLRSHAVTAFGAPKYGPGFKHFDYVNPDAPKGGVFSTSASGVNTYDSLNPYILRGAPAEQLSLIYDTLMVRSIDEPSTSYGLVAESVAVAPDHSSITFYMRPQARWHDGVQMTAHDVEWSFRTLREKGHPFFANNYTEVKDVTAVDEYTVRFDLSADSNRLLPLILGDMPILPKHYWEKVGVDFDSSGTVMPLGSGPYRLDSYSLGSSIKYSRVEDWWARDLPVNRGRFNFDQIRIDYFRDNSARFEAFKAGQYNYLQENIAQRWATAYDFPAMHDGRILRESIPHNEPAGMQGFVFNTRREKFQDPRVREAIALLFNFEWGNKYLAYDAYTRTDSYFENTNLASSGLPQGREREILEQFRGRIPDNIFNEPFSLPVYRGPDGKLDVYEMRRANLRRSMALLKESGYGVQNMKMVNLKTGQPLKIEFLLISPAFERWIMPYKANLARLGIDISIRTVDSSQYMNRFKAFDYDMVVAVIRTNNTPGAELYDYWHSKTAFQNGSSNYAGVRDPVIDKLLDVVIAAQTKDELIASTHALDRVLLRGHYVVPHYHINSYRVGYGRELDRPRGKMDFRMGLGVPDTWWYRNSPPRPLSPGPG